MATDGGRIGYKDGMLKRGLKAITGTDTYKTLESKGFNAAVIMNEGFDEIYNLLSGIPGLQKVVVLATLKVNLFLKMQLDF